MLIDQAKTFTVSRKTVHLDGYHHDALFVPALSYCVALLLFFSFRSKHLHVDVCVDLSMWAAAQRRDGDRTKLGTTCQHAWLSKTGHYTLLTCWISNCVGVGEMDYRMEIRRRRKQNLRFNGVNQMWNVHVMWITFCVSDLCMFRLSFHHIRYAIAKKKDVLLDSDHCWNNYDYFIVFEPSPPQQLLFWIVDKLSVSITHVTIWHLTVSGWWHKVQINCTCSQSLWIFFAPIRTAVWDILCMNGIWEIAIMKSGIIDI